MGKNYERDMEKSLSELGTGSDSPKLLLHCCCAPCASIVLERLSPYFDITLFFYNPCLWPKEEFMRRLDSLFLLLDAAVYPGTISLLETDWRTDDFREILDSFEQMPEGGTRCELCFTQRLGETAKTAADLKKDYFCSTLTVGPRKSAELINSIGFKQAKIYGINWLPSDFKKKGGFKRSVELSNNYGLYRQNYCGCFATKNKITGNHYKNTV